MHTQKTPTGADDAVFVVVAADSVKHLDMPTGPHDCDAFARRAMMDGR
jgi:hypothetical protein